MISWIYAALLLNNLRTSTTSIAGITYMDNFNFAQRYQDVNECNPLYWHPLHLPDHCTEMFESAIISASKSNLPSRIVRKRKGKVIEISSPYGLSSSDGVEAFQAPISEEISNYGQPFEKMLKLLSRDVKDHPRAPTVGFMPNVGLVALYQQPISRKSEKMIKKVANKYTPDIQYNDPTYFPLNRDTPWNQPKPSKQKDNVKLKSNKSKKRPRVIKKKIKRGRALAILKKKIY